MLRLFQREREDRSLARLACYGDSAAMQLHDMFYNGQPESGSTLLAGSRLIHPVKTLKDSRQILEGDTDAGIRNRYFDIFTAILGKQADRTAIGSVFDGVLQQVDHYLFETPLIGHDTRQRAAGGFIDYRDVFLHRPLPQQHARLGNSSRNIERIQLDERLLCFETRQREDIVDQ